MKRLLCGLRDLISIAIIAVIVLITLFATMMAFDLLPDEIHPSSSQYGLTAVAKWLVAVLVVLNPGRFLAMHKRMADGLTLRQRE